MMEREAASDGLLRPGTPVGEYRVVEPIGKGGMGVVYRGTHPELDNAVAIKVLARDHAWDPNAVARFKREARLVSQLRHPNIVQAFSFGSLPDGRRYYVMDFLEGGSLKELLAERGYLPAEEAISIVHGVAEALSAAHAAGIVHRDVKPGNIFLQRGGGVKLLDFGIAKAAFDESTAEARTDTGLLPGTPRYMSPEQARGVAVDHRTDIYSLALVAFECLTGKTPFGDGPTGELLMHHQVTPPPAPSQICAGLPPALDGPILEAMQKDPGKRQQSALDLGEELKRALGLGRLPAPGWRGIAASEAVSTVRGGIPPQRERTRMLGASRRVSTLFIAGAGLLLLAALASLVAWWTINPVPARSSQLRGVGADARVDVEVVQLKKDAAVMPSADMTSAKHEPPKKRPPRKKRRPRSKKKKKRGEGSLIRF